MWVLASNGSSIVNLDVCKNVFFTTVDSGDVLISARINSGGKDEAKLLNIGEYATASFAREELQKLANAIAREVTLYTMADSYIDRPSQRVRDSEVKHGNGS